MSSSFHPDMFGKSPIPGRGGSYFPHTHGGSTRYSRYRADFEEVEFLVSTTTHNAALQPRTDSNRVKVALVKW